MKQQTIRKRLLDEHRVLQEVMASLKSAADSASTPSTDRWLAAVRDRFAHFRAHMNRRFALEEVGGLYEDFLRLRPTSAADVDELRRAHRDLLAGIESMQSLLNSGPDTPGLDPPAVSQRTADLLTRVQRHADREELMFSVLFTQDDGGTG